VTVQPSPAAGAGSGSGSGNDRPSETWELVARPHRSARISIVVAAVVLLIFIGIGLFLPDEKAGVTFTGADQWAMAGIGVLLACFILAFTRPRVRAGWPGVETRGFFGGARLVEWPLIAGVDFVPKTRFARLILPADEVVALYAIQRGDREVSVAVMNQLRTLHARWAQ
jgi:Bacterial PH domain